MGDYPDFLFNNGWENKKIGIFIKNKILLSPFYGLMRLYMQERVQSPKIPISILEKLKTSYIVD